MMGLVNPSYPNANRVAPLPDNIKDCFGKVIVEKGFGASLGVLGEVYRHNGEIISEKPGIFERCSFIYSLKFLQPCDYELLRDWRVIIGWTHPTGNWCWHTIFWHYLPAKEIKIYSRDSRVPGLHHWQ